MAVGSQTVMLPKARDEEMGGSLQPAAAEAAEEEEVRHRGVTTHEHTGSVTSRYTLQAGKVC